MLNNNFLKQNLRSAYYFFRSIVYTNTYITNLVFSYNKRRFKKYSGVNNDSQTKDMAFITWLYHVVEKGLAMPSMRMGFGIDKIKMLSCKIYFCYEKYGMQPQIQSAISVIKEYDRVHKESGFRLDSEIQSIIDKVCIDFPKVAPLIQTTFTRDEFFALSSADFYQFSKSRHSVRNFSGTISLKQITDAIDLARFCPSACNRQPVRVHVIVNKELKDACLALQNGNRGFGNLSDKLLIITGDLSTVLGGQEFFDLATNVGIFIMNLSYALHYNKVAHCILNWYAMPKQDMELRKLVNIPKEECVYALIVCGDVPEKFKVVMSPRIDVNNIYTVHE